MFRFSVAILLLLTAVVLQAADDMEKVHDELVASLKSLSAELKTVKDKKSLAAATTNLKALDEKLLPLRKQLEAFKPTAAQKKALEAKYDKPLQEASEAMSAEVARLEKLPEVYSSLLKESTWINFELRAKTDMVKFNFQVIEKCLKIHMLKKDLENYPEKLNIVETYLEDPKSALKDPWGGEVHYDPKGPKNKGMKPDLWVVTPWKQTIGNWNEVKK